MTKSVVATTHTLYDQGSGVFRASVPSAPSARPRVVVTDANPNKNTLIAAYAGSEYQQRVQERAAGATWFNYADWHMAIGYSLDNDPAVGADLVSRVDARVVAHETAISNYIASGDNNDLRAAGSSSQNWLYSNDELFVTVALTYDACYDLLTPTQRTRWRDTAFQFMYAMRHPTDCVYHSGGSSRNGVQTNWGMDPAWPTSNYYQHHVLGMVAMALAFKDDPAVEYTMQSGPVSLTGDWLLNEFTSVDIPILANDLAKMPKGGSMEGTGYGVALADVYFAKILYESSTGTNIFSDTAIETYMEETANWTLHQMLPINVGTTRDIHWISGAHPGNSRGENIDQYRRMLVAAINANPSMTYAPEMKRMAVDQNELGPIYTSNHYYHLTNEFLAQPALDSIVGSSDYSALPNMHAATQVGDTYFRSDWDDDSTVAIHIRSGEIHNGNHAWCDATSIQIYKNGYLVCNNMMNGKSGDNDLAGTVANVLDRTDKRFLSLIGTGELHEYYPNGNLRTASQELTNQNPIVHYAEDNTATDGDFYFSMDAARAYQNSSNGDDMNKMQRDVVFFPQGIVLIFDRLETASSQTFTAQFSPPFQPTVNGAQFTVNNGTSSAEFSLLTQSSNWNSVLLTANGETNWATQYGDGPYQVRNILGAGTSMSTITAVNIDGAAASITLGSGAAGEHVVIVDFADATPTKTITFYDAQQRRSIV